MTKLEYLLNYALPKGIGSKDALVDGAKATANSIFIVVDDAAGASLGLKGSQIVTIQSLPGALKGKTVPIVIDPAALQVLFKDHQEAIPMIPNSEKE